MLLYGSEVVLKGCVIPRARPDAAARELQATFQNEVNRRTLLEMDSISVHLL